MLLGSSFQEADANRREVEVHGDRYLLRGYVGAAPQRGTYVDGNEVNDNRLPQGFLVQQPPRSVTPPHFHETAQFQVFVGGGGRVGKQAANPVTVQFAGGHTPYGPITAEDDGIEYFTLRQRWDPGAKYMPRMRDRLKRGQQRQRVARVSRAQESETLIGPEDDGLLAARFVVAGGCSQPLPPASDGGGQYLVVLAGTLRVGERGYDRLACLYCTPDEPGLALTAGPAGLDALLLRFPRPEAA